MYWFYNDLALIFFFMLSANTISQTEGVLQIYTCAHLSYHWKSRFEEVVFLDAVSLSVLQNRWQDMSKKRREHHAAQVLITWSSGFILALCKSNIYHDAIAVLLKVILYTKTNEIRKIDVDKRLTEPRLRVYNMLCSILAAVLFFSKTIIIFNFILRISASRRGAIASRTKYHYKI